MSPSQSTGQATAVAHPNIALVKYWGKRDPELNLPAAGSVSITLDELRTRTTVTLDPGLDQDVFMLDGAVDARRAVRVTDSLDRIRALASVATPARVESDNNFPTAAGLASSASGFAALVTAAAAAYGLELGDAELSVEARRGSGSAARSIFGGFARMEAGRAADGSDAYARSLLDAAEWPLQVVIAITSTAAKADGSTAGMERSRRTSPYYEAWVETTPQDIEDACAAIESRDFQRLAEISEHSCLKMHALMMATRPPLVYWNGATMAAIQTVRELRAQGHGVFFTVDAGPQVKAICEPAAAATVRDALAAVPGVQRVQTVGLGGPARLIDPRQ